MENTGFKEIPSAVCGDIKMRHGIVLAKSVPAGACGHDFRCTEKISGPYDASPRYSLYETSSRALLSIFRDFAPGVKQYSTDEACCGMAGAAALGETIGMRLWKDDVKISAIAASVKNFALQSSRHQKTIFTATSQTNEIYRCAAKVFDELWDGRTPIRQIGIHTGKGHLRRQRPAAQFIYHGYLRETGAALCID